MVLVSTHSRFRYGATSERPAFAAHRSIFGSGIAIMSPARIPDQLTSSFLNGSAGTANSFWPTRKLSGSVTGLPHIP